MALTRDFRTTVKARAEKDPAFRAALYQEAVQALVDGDLATAKVLLRDYINATVGFTQLSQETALPAKSLLRMFGVSGNPRADNMLNVLRHLRVAEKLNVTVSATIAPHRKARRVAERVAA